MSIDKLRAESALKLLFMADVLTMPVHWYYNIKDIQHQFPGGIRLFEAAPDKLPSSIMHLHSTSAGGRGNQQGNIVGDVILKGRKRLWGQAYVTFMTADPPHHPDTYAESFHCGFFANWQAGKELIQCGAITHDTPSIGALALPLLASGALPGS